jgi:hypothetical protein
MANKNVNDPAQMDQDNQQQELTPEEQQELANMQQNADPNQPQTAAMPTPTPTPRAVYDRSQQPKNQIKDLQNKADIATYGVGSALSADDTKLAKIVSQTASDVIDKFGKRTAANDIVGMLTSDALQKLGNDKSSSADKPLETYRDVLEKNVDFASSIMTSENNRVVDYDNYEEMALYIPECSFALDTYTSNILSPDDYSKMIFNIYYNDVDMSGNATVNENMKAIVKRYKLEDKADRIIRETLEYGDCYLAVLPYGKEIGRMLSGMSLSSNSSGILSESTDISKLASLNEYSYLDEEFGITKQITTIPLTEELDNTFLTKDDIRVLNECFGGEEDEELDGDSVKTIEENYNKLVNNIQVHSVTDMLLERANNDAESGVFGLLSSIGADVSVHDADGVINKKKSDKTVKNAEKISGAALRFLEAKHVVELTVDDICYGYYYIEPGSPQDAPDSPLAASFSKMSASTSNPMNPSLVPNNLPASETGSSTPAAKNMKITDAKMKAISGIILKGLSKKLNRKFIENNKQFKDIIYSLLRQEYILKKGVNVTFFMPDEVVHFNYQSIFKNITFFAKLYLADITNTIVTKLGRGKDKRIVFVDAGLDANYSQSITKIIEDLKTREFKMSDIDSIQDILSLNPAQFEDVFIPTINGQAPINFGTYAGMDKELNSDFSEYLKKSMVNGMDLPAAIIDEKDSLDYSRQVAEQNSHFLRKIMNAQREFEPKFTQLIQLLYKYDYTIANDGEVPKTDKNADPKDATSMAPIDYNKITVKFPVPGILTKTSLSTQIIVTQQFADAIAKTYYPDTPDGSNMANFSKMSGLILRNEFPQIDWVTYDKLKSKIENEQKKEAVSVAADDTQADASDANMMNSPINPDGSPANLPPMGGSGNPGQY